MKTSRSQGKGKKKRKGAPATLEEEEETSIHMVAGPSSSSSSAGSSSAPPPPEEAITHLRPRRKRTKAKKESTREEAKEEVNISPMIQLFMKALDCALISSEMLRSQELFQLSQACRGAAGIVRQRVKAIGGRISVLSVLDKFPGARNLTLRFDQVLRHQLIDGGTRTTQAPAGQGQPSTTSSSSSSSSASFIWAVPSRNTSKLQASFKDFAASRLHSLKVIIDCSSRAKKKVAKTETGIQDPLLFLFPGLESASHLTSMNLMVGGDTTWGSVAPMLPGLQRILSEVSFHQLLHLTLGRYRLDLIAEALSPALQRDGFPRLQSIQLVLQQEEPPSASVPSITTFLRRLFSGSCLKALREAKLQGRLGALPDGSSVICSLLACDEGDVRPEKLDVVLVSDDKALRCINQFIQHDADPRIQLLGVSLLCSSSYSRDLLSLTSIITKLRDALLITNNLEHRKRFFDGMAKCWKMASFNTAIAAHRSIFFETFAEIAMESTMGPASIITSLSWSEELQKGLQEYGPAARALLTSATTAMLSTTAGHTLRQKSASWMVSELHSYSIKKADGAWLSAEATTDNDTPPVLLAEPPTNELDVAKVITDACGLSPLEAMRWMVKNQGIIGHGAEAKLGKTIWDLLKDGKLKLETLLGEAKEDLGPDLALLLLNACPGNKCFDFDGLQDLLADELCRWPKRYQKDAYGIILPYIKATSFSMYGRARRVTKDIPPFLKAVMEPERWHGFWEVIGAFIRGWYDYDATQLVLRAAAAAAMSPQVPAGSDDVYSKGFKDYCTKSLDPFRFLQDGPELMSSWLVPAVWGDALGYLRATLHEIKHQNGPANHLSGRPLERLVVALSLIEDDDDIIHDDEGLQDQIEATVDQTKGRLAGLMTKDFRGDLFKKRRSAGTEIVCKAIKRLVDLSDGFAGQVLEEEKNKKGQSILSAVVGAFGGDGAGGGKAKKSALNRRTLMQSITLSLYKQQPEETLMALLKMKDKEERDGVANILHMLSTAPHQVLSTDLLLSLCNISKAHVKKDVVGLPAVLRLFLTKDGFERSPITKKLKEPPQVQAMVQRAIQHLRAKEKKNGKEQEEHGVVDNDRNSFGAVWSPSNVLETLLAINKRPSSIAMTALAQSTTFHELASWLKPYTLIMVAIHTPSLINPLLSLASSSFTNTHAAIREAVKESLMVAIDLKARESLLGACLSSDDYVPALQRFLQSQTTTDLTQHLNHQVIKIKPAVRRARTVELGRLARAMDMK